MDERVHISTPDHVSLEFELAGAGSRFAAYLIDFVLTVLLIIAVVFAAVFAGGWVALRALAGGAGGTIGASWIWAIVVLVIFLINWGYYVFFEGLRRGSTPGKRRMGIRVIRQDGLPVGLREAALRNLVRAADILPPPSYILGGLVMHFDRHGRRLGDMLAGTYVVVENFAMPSQSASGAAWAKRIEQGGSRQGLTLPRGTISAQQLALIEQFFARADAISPERRDQLIWQIAEPLLPMLNEDREAVARSPERTDRCRRLLLEILELAQEKKPAAAIAAVRNPPPATLF